MHYLEVMSAQHFPRVKTGTIEIFCSTGLEVCCATGGVSASRRHGEGRLKEPDVFSLAKPGLSSNTVCAKYTRGEGCWNWLNLEDSVCTKATGNTQVIK